jgi:tRNA threonylcarbamoyladenosine biosynthesis protein TsaE
MSDSLEIVTRGPEDTQRVGCWLGRSARAGDIILLAGDLGAGKTTLTQGIAWGLGVKEHARSPTFVMVTEYAGRLTLHHADLYRVDSLAEAMDLGLYEMFFGEGVSVVEWADRALSDFPEDHLWVRLDGLDPLDEDSRRLRLVAHGPRYRQLLEAVRSEQTATDGG